MFFFLACSEPRKWMRTPKQSLTVRQGDGQHSEFMTITAQRRQKPHHFQTEKRWNIMWGWFTLSHHVSLYLTFQEPAQKVTSPLGRVRTWCIRVCQHDIFIILQIFVKTQHEGSRHLEVSEMVLADIARQSEPSKALGSDTEEYSFAEHTAQKSGCSKAQNCLDSLHRWSTLQTHPSLPGQSCTDSSAPKVTLLVNWKKAAHLQGKATEQWISFWRDYARLFVTLTLSLRSTSLLWQWSWRWWSLLDETFVSAVPRTRLGSQKV